MKVAFRHNLSKREMDLCAALRRGVNLHGDTFKATHDDIVDIDSDVVAFVGMKGYRLHVECLAKGQRFLYFDKGYYYPEENYAAKVAKQAKVVQCWRVSADSTQPLEYLSAARHSIKRWNAFGPRPKPWREPTSNGHIILAGSSMKYHQFNSLPHPTEYFKAIVAELRQHTDRPIHYRPKPSWGDAVPIADTEFIPTGSFESHLKGAHAIITHGSNASLIGMLSGIPSIILGNGVMRLISSTELSAIEEPYLATMEERLQLLANLAWSQFTLGEFTDGRAWGHIKTMLLQ